jgi:hypothetical protein
MRSAAKFRIHGAKRLSVHATVVFLGWPLFTVFMAVVEARRMPYLPISWLHALAGVLVGLLLLLPEFLIVGGLYLLVSHRLFARFGADAEQAARLRLALEPIVVFLALLLGALVWHPGSIAHPVFTPLANVPVWAVTQLVALLVAIGGCMLAKAGARAILSVSVVALGIASPLPLQMKTWLAGYGRPPADLVLLGLDSVSVSDDVAHLENWVKSRQGTWYTRAVTPALLTNAVWSSILTAQPVSESGIFHTFQDLDRGSDQLVAEAKRQGYRTVSFFPDQFTCTVGSTAGFDEDLSGPIGWRQIVLPTVANASVLVPLVKPLLPRSHWLSAPPNLSGTYTYDPRRDLRELLTAGDGRNRVFAVGHLTYLHTPAYPRYMDLSFSEMWRVLHAPAGLVRDRSFDWQDGDHYWDPIPLHAWKLAHLQAITTVEIERSGVLNAGKVLIMSDHGDRAGLRNESFSEERYHRVVLATIGLPARNSDEPLSLTAVGELLQITKTKRPHAATVEFVIAPPSLWPVLLNTAKVRWSGVVELDADLLQQVRSGLRSYTPYSGPPPEPRVQAARQQLQH